MAASSSASSDRAIRSDWLEVRSRIIGLWERRYVVLEPTRMCVYRQGATASQPGKLATETRCAEDASEIYVRAGRTRLTQTRGVLQAGEIYPTYASRCLSSPSPGALA